MTKQKMMSFKPHSPEAVVRLKNGRFIDVEKGCYFDSNVDVFLHQGRIKAMPGLLGEPTDLEHDITYDLGGRAVMPGLFNTHSHIHLKLPALMLQMSDVKLVKKYGKKQLHKEMADCLDRGITTIRDCITDDLADTWELRDAIEAGKIPGPRVLQSVLVGMLGSTWTPKRGLSDRFQNWAGGMPFVDYENRRSGLLAFSPEASETQVRDAVDRALDERKADTIKIYEQRAYKVTFKPGAPLMSEVQLFAIADQARKRGVATTAHYVSVESYRRILAAGVTSLAHLPLDKELTDKDIDILLEAGIPVDPTFSVALDMCWNLPGMYDHRFDEIEWLETYRDKNIKRIAQDFWLPEFQQSVIKGYEKARQGKTKLLGLMDLAGGMKFMSDYIFTGVVNLRKMVDRGVPLGCGNDGGIPPCTVAMVANELAMLTSVLNKEKVRFTAAEALRTATIHSARGMGLDADLGSIKTGKIADLVVVNGDPLADINVIGSPAAAVFRDGQLVSRKNRDFK